MGLPIQISDYQLYNSIITAHAILMSAPLRSEVGPLNNSTVKGNSYVRRRQVGGAKLHDEKITTKLMQKGTNVISPLIIGYRA